MSWFDAERYGLAALLALVLIAVKFLLPALINNEMIYVLSPRIFVEPAFLASDWNVGAESRRGLLALPALGLIGGLWLILDDALAVVADRRRVAVAVNLRPGFLQPFPDLFVDLPGALPRVEELVDQRLWPTLARAQGIAHDRYQAQALDSLARPVWMDGAGGDTPDLLRVVDHAELGQGAAEV